MAKSKIKSSDELREAYLNFFEGKGHKRVPSSPLVLEDDPTLLFTSAGMNQFKEQFLGHIKGYTRATSCQKCLRTADLVRVGHTPSHHTFFEMLGNFSFGDYFKKEAIEWAWEFVVDVLGMDKKQIWASVYHSDDEAFGIWHKGIGLPEKKIIRLGEKDNFWPSNAIESGPDGPCGPCSELYFDQGEDVGCKQPKCSPICECGRFVEVWNLVFTQFNRVATGRIDPLGSKNIDTGMGLERMARIIQNVKTNFEIDIFAPIVGDICKELKLKYGADTKKDSLINAIADHVRAASFAILDGVVPSNESRGYVVRKLIRRAAWYSRSLGKKDAYLYKFVSVIGKLMHVSYPELESHRENISHVILSEEKRFGDTIDSGSQILDDIINKTKSSSSKIVSGEDAFKLYDTYGFPLELTGEIATSHGLAVDIEGFDKMMGAQKEKSRSSSKLEGSVFSGRLTQAVGHKTKFVGYDFLKLQAKVIAIIKEGASVEALKEEEKGEIILDATPFYGESGGQVGDTGLLLSSSFRAVVSDAQWNGEATAHKVQVEKGSIKRGDSVEACVDICHREAVKRNHTATHLLQAALRSLLGDHVRQSGSLVAPERLRFDFSHFSALTPQELEGVEKLVNEMILKNLKVECKEMSLDEAKRSGATALFGEKYSDNVRVITVSDASKELCGGTHVQSTSEIGLFKIISEGSVQSGIRRIEALTGLGFYEKAKEDSQTLDGISILFKAPRARILQEIEKLQSYAKSLEKELGALKVKSLASGIDDIIAKGDKVGNSIVIAEDIQGADAQSLRGIMDSLKAKAKSGIFTLSSTMQDKISFAVGVTQDLVDKGIDAGRLVGAVAKVAGGGGGGRKDFAEGAGGKDVSKVKEALQKAKELAKEEINKL